MKRFVVVALACIAAMGCKKAFNKLEQQAEQPGTNSGPAVGPASGGGGGAVMAVRGAANRTVTAAELHDLHIFMHNSKAALGRVPTAQETWNEISAPSGNQKLAQMIREGLIVLVPNPQDEGIWAYDKNAPTQGGWILMHSEPRRVTAEEFAQLARQ